MYTIHTNSLYNQPRISGHATPSTNWGDGYIFMLHPNLTPIWSTYFGGNHVDGIHAGCINNSASTLVIAGYSGSDDSTSFPIVGQGAQWSNGSGLGWGNTDGFCTKFLISNIYLLSVPENTVPISVDAFSVYPNPNTGQFVISVGQDKKPLTLTVTNALGQVVYLQNKPETDSNGLIYLDLQNLNQGIYFVNLDYGNNSQTQKLSIIR